MIWKTTISKITETITTGLSRQFKSFGIIMILAFLGSTPNLFAQSAECEIIEAECPPSNLFEPCGDVTVDDVLGNYITWTGPDYSLECGDGNTYQYQISFDLPEGKEECWEFYKVQRVGTGSGTLRLWSSDGSASGIAEVTSPSFYMDEIVNASMDVFAPNNQDFKVDVYLEEADGSRSGILDSFNVFGNNSLTNYQYSVDPSYFDGSGSYDDNKIFRLYFEFSAINGTNLNNKSYIEFITIDAGLFGSACAAEANFAVVSTHNPGDFFPVGTTTVTYTATCNGCEEFLQESCSFDVTVNPLPEVNISSDTELALDCANSSTTLTASGGTSYAWTNSNGDDLGTNASITVSTEDTFTVTVSNDNGCTDTGSVSTTLNNTDPTAVINNNNGLALDCANSSTTLTASGGTSYAWTNSNDDDLGTNASITVSTQDTFTVTVTAENGCTDTESVSTTLDDTAPSAMINNNNGLALNCDTPSTTLTASGGTTFAWTNSNGDDLGTDASITVSTEDTFTVTVTADNGCTDTESVSTTLDDTAPTAEAGENAELTCSV
uniref:HYR domain-containing protein n=1 Tax=Christiangramia echinicola TaxID=279359 RepID=UPI0005575668